MKSLFPRARARHFSTCFNFSTWNPYSGAFFLTDQRGIFSFPKMFALTGPNVIEILKITLGGYKNQIVQILTNGD